MKFTLTLEVNAPEYTADDNYPREVHAVEWMNEQLTRSAAACRFHIMKALIDKNDNSDYFIKSMEAEIEKIEAVRKTISLR